MQQDLRYTLRVLRKDFGFAAIAVVTLALGIGANTAIFTVVNAVLLRPLPYTKSEQLVVVYQTDAKKSIGQASFSLTRLQQLRTQSKSFSNFAGYCGESFNLTGIQRPQQLQGVRVTSNFFTTLGVNPILGRDFLPDEDREGGNPVVLLSYALWQRQFGGDPKISGTNIMLDSAPYTVIGVLPPGVDQPAPEVEIFATNLAAFSRFTRDQIRLGGGYISSIARLKPGVSMQQAQAQMDVLGRQYLAQNSGMVDADPDGRMEIGSLQESVVSNVRPALLVLFAAVGAVLLIACANIASLLLARASGRRKEFAVRAALGARRADLIRQLLYESVVLSIASGVLGLLIALAAVRGLVAIPGLDLPRVEEIGLDWQVLAFTFLVSIFTGAIFGLVPSLQVSKPDLNLILRESARGSAGSVRRNHARSLLVVGQVAASMVLLIAASLLMRSFVALQRVDPGFDARNVLTMRLTLSPAKYPSNSQKNVFFRDALNRIAALPGVQFASAMLSLPLSNNVMVPLQVAGEPVLPFGQRKTVNWQSITPDYFKTLGTRVLRGRAFSDHDNEASAGVAIVNETMARRFWPGRDAVGQRLIVARAELHVEVVGVVADVKNGGLDVDSTAQLFSPYAQRPWPGMNLAIKTSGDPLSMANAVRHEIQQLDRDLPVTNVRSLESIVSGSFGQRKLTLWLLGAFAGLALALAAIGIYGLLAYSVEQRRQEMGIRRALGARPADILSMVLREGLGLTLAGILVGSVGAFAATKALTGLLFHVSPSDPAIFAAMAILFLGVAGISSYLPARRALSVDPLSAMRD